MRYAAAPFRPMDELHQEGRDVEMRLCDGRVVIGWLFCGMPYTPRSFWSRDKRGSSIMIQPTGWRIPPMQAVAA